MWTGSRRSFLRVAATRMAAAGLGMAAAPLWSQIAGERPEPDPQLRVLLPRMRVPVSLIIDDSTCLVNLNRFAIPQFAAAFGHARYGQDWRSMPDEIPDDFVRRFGEWCGEHGVKGKYSVVPFPACIGRLDLELPGWTRGERLASLELVRTLLLPNWDIHPEMVTHTRVIDLRTGHPFPEISPRFMENWDWTDGRSVDELASYLAYALGILREVGLPCEGITTPGGFGNEVLPELAQATLQACRDVFQAEIPHYFRHLYDEGERSVAPRVEYAGQLDGPDPRCVVSIVGCTGDWTGNWDCSTQPEPDRFITPDLQSGRLVEVIQRGEPAILVCHWTGIYYNGQERGFRAFQEVVRRLHERFDNLVWMKNSEIARYWAARELTRLRLSDGRVELQAPYACPRFTLRIAAAAPAPPQFAAGGTVLPLIEVARATELDSGKFLRQENATIACFDLPRGPSTVQL